MNEVLFVPSQETLFFTDKCLRDTINSVGILCANHPGILRRDCGRIIASPRGISRLIRFFVEKKIKVMYLPHSWVGSNREEAKRIGKGLLGAYGLVLIERYRANKPLQLRFMKVLNDLSITNLKHFDTFAEEQKILFEGARGEEFIMRKRSFEEIQKKISEGKEQALLAKTKRREKRASCSHERIKEFVCQRCLWYCDIKKCLDCDKVEITPRRSKEPLPIDQLFCNKNFIAANVYWDKGGFFPSYPFELSAD